MRLGEVRTGAGGGILACASACAAALVLPAVARAEEPPLPPVGEARPPPPEEPKPAPVQWNRHIEVGGGVAFTQMNAAAQPKQIRFLPGAGFHVDLSWNILRYLRFSGYMLEHNNTLVVPFGALVGGAAFDAPSVHVYSFGVRASPTLPIGQRMRLWATVGLGWGYLGYGRFTQLDVPPGALNPSPVIRERSSTIFEIPVGAGYLVEIIPRWLSLHFEATASFAPSQVGDALQPGQYIDAKGFIRTVGPMPNIGVAFAQTLGLSVHL